MKGKGVYYEKDTLQAESQGLSFAYGNMFYNGLHSLGVSSIE